MATSYSDVINMFIFKTKAYKLMDLPLEDKNEIAVSYLKSACAKFYKKCKHNLLNCDEDFQTFEEDLDLDEMDILSEIMITEWLSPQIYNDELLESRLNTKDFTEYSPAKLIEQIRNVYNESRTKAKYMMIQYTYDHGNVRNLDEE
ncbi:MAG: hypothetical protein NC244_07765 [Alistipes senegalensis]|nr:hypothetical protein [Alistipes senegalensis]